MVIIMFVCVCVWEGVRECGVGGRCVSQITNTTLLVVLETNSGLADSCDAPIKP